MRKILQMFLEKSPDIRTIKELLERLKPENLKSGDIIKTLEYIGEIDKIKSGEQENCLKIYFKWAHCIASESKDHFHGDYINVLKNNIEVLKTNE